MNGAIVFQGHVTGYQDTVSYSLPSLSLTSGSTVDFELAWAGGVYSEYGWTQANASITEGAEAAPEPSSILLELTTLIATLIALSFKK